MTATTVVFDPFSEDFFKGPYEIYRRLRDEAPVYYSPEYDFYALTRHQDVAAAFKDHETYSSAYGVDLAQVRRGEVAKHGGIIAMDPPEHRRMRSLLNKVFTPRAIEARRELVTTTIEQVLSRVDRDGFDFVQDFSALFPVEVMTILQGVPEPDRQQIRLWIDDFLHRDPGQVEMSEEGMKSAIDMSVYYYQLIKERRKNLGDDLLSKLIESEIEREDGEMTPLNNLEDHRVRRAAGRGRRGDGDQAARQRRGGVRPESRPVAKAARRSRKGAAGRRGTAALRGPGAVQRAPLDA